ncbi:TPA: DUF2513 domain-containing protein [Vibrio parahaemolyticus]|nr:DUF2513 domain-containing protein [Vibrio parahaemolyticus]
MKVSYEYLKGLLEVFEKTEVPFPLLSDIAEEVGGIDSNFAFHMDLLFDQGFIQYMNREGKSPFMPSSYNDDFDYIECDVRLTAQGYDFLAVLHQKEIWNAIQSELKENSIQTVWKVAQGFATKLASNQLGKYLDVDSLK